jgi:polyhydroxyalkanoate synthesis regulator phasin
MGDSFNPEEGNMRDDDFEKEAERLAHRAELEQRDEEISRLRRRVADLEDFLRGASRMFAAAAGQ